MHTLIRYKAQDSGMVTYESNQTQPPCLPPFFFNADLTNNKQTITKPKAAKPPTAMATVFCVCCFPVPTRTKHVTCTKALDLYATPRLNVELKAPTYPNHT